MYTIIDRYHCGCYITKCTAHVEAVQCCLDGNMERNFSSFFTTLMGSMSHACIYSNGWQTFVLTPHFPSASSFYYKITVHSYIFYTQGTDFNILCCANDWSPQYWPHKLRKTCFRQRRFTTVENLFWNSCYILLYLKLSMNIRCTSATMIGNNNWYDNNTKHLDCIPKIQKHSDRTAKLLFVKSKIYSKCEDSLQSSKGWQSSFLSVD